MKRFGWILVIIGLSPIAIALSYMAIGYVTWSDIGGLLGSIIIANLILAGLGAVLINLRKWMGETDDELPSQESSIGDGVQQEPTLPVKSTRETHKFFLGWGAALSAFVALSFFSTLTSCPDGQNSGGIDVNGGITSGTTLTGMSCFWAVPLTNFFGSIFGLAAIVFLIIGLVRLRSNKG